MTKLLSVPLLAVLLFSAVGAPCPAYAASAKRIAVEARVKADVAKDLALPWQPLDALAERTCLDGRLVKDFQGDIVEYWANIEWCAV